MCVDLFPWYVAGLFELLLDVTRGFTVAVTTFMGKKKRLPCHSCFKSVTKQSKRTSSPIQYRSQTAWCYGWVEYCTGLANHIFTHFIFKREYYKTLSTLYEYTRESLLFVQSYSIVIYYMFMRRLGPFPVVITITAQRDYAHKYM